MATAFIRTIILYFILMTGLRLMGKRQIGELEPTELVMTLLISDLAVVPMQDFGIPLLNGVVPILTLLSLSLLLSHGNLHSVRFRRLFCGKPTLLIRDGVILQQTMRQNRFTTDELLEELRAKGVCDLTTVKYAVLETNGQLSILLRAAQQPVTPAQMGLDVEDDVFLPIVLISDGRLLEQNLPLCGRTKAWLLQEMAARGLVRWSDVFLFTVDGRGAIICLKKEPSQ